MESTSFAPASERFMIDHMNADHADANLMYVKAYGHMWEATAARLLRLDKTGMELARIFHKKAQTSCKSLIEWYV